MKPVCNSGSPMQMLFRESPSGLLRRGLLVLSLLAALCLIAAQCLTFGTALAQEGNHAPGAQQGASVRGQVLTVLASRTEGTIDPRLHDLPALRRPPFDSYHSMQLLRADAVELALHRPQVLSLPNGRRVRIVLQEITRDGRYRIRLSINRPDQEDYLPELRVVTSPGDPFFVAGQSHQGGTLVIGIRLGTRPSHP